MRSKANTQLLTDKKNSEAKIPLRFQLYNAMNEMRIKIDSGILSRSDLEELNTPNRTHQQ
jgi:hypothetical protein